MLSAIRSIVSKLINESKVKIPPKVFSSKYWQSTKTTETDWKKRKIKYTKLVLKQEYSEYSRIILLMKCNIFIVVLFCFGFYVIFGNAVGTALDCGALVASIFSLLSVNLIPSSMNSTNHRNESVVPNFFRWFYFYPVALLPKNNRLSFIFVIFELQFFLEFFSTYCTFSINVWHVRLRALNFNMKKAGNKTCLCGEESIRGT